MSLRARRERCYVKLCRGELGPETTCGYVLAVGPELLLLASDCDHVP